MLYYHHSYTWKCMRKKYIFCLYSHIKLTCFGAIVLYKVSFFIGNLVHVFFARKFLLCFFFLRFYCFPTTTTVLRTSSTLSRQGRNQQVDMEIPIFLLHVGNSFFPLYSSTYYCYCAKGNVQVDSLQVEHITYSVLSKG